MAINLATMARRSQPSRRKAITLRPIETTQTLAHELAAIYIKVVRAWALQARDRILPVYQSSLDQRRPRDALTRDDANQINHELEQAEGYLARLILMLTPSVSDWVTRTEKWHRNRFVGMTKTATGIDLQTMIGPEGAQQTMAAVLARNVGLIRSVDDETRKRIGDLVWAGFTARQPTQDLAGDINDVVQLGRTRSLNIASDQTVKLSAALDEERQREVGISEFIWRHSHKVHFRPEHKARDGQIFPWDGNNLDGDLPGVAPYCFPSDQPVWIADDILRLWRHRYSGHLTALITDSGESIDCTPNHPVLTNAGWKSAKAVNIGDYLVETEFSGLDVSNVDVEQRQPRIGDLFEAGKALFGVVTTNGRGGEFHGDAASGQDIEVVDTQGGLLNHLKAVGSEFGGEPVFKNSEATTKAALERLCSLSLFGNGVDAPAHSFVSLGRALSSFLWAQALHDKPMRGARVADLYAFTAHEFGEGLTRYASALADRLDALSDLISPDGIRAVILDSVWRNAIDSLGKEAPPQFEMLGKSASAVPHDLGGVPKKSPGVDLRYHRVKDCISRTWFGHVFNLETRCGWYSAHRISVRNCGCKAQAYLNLENP